MSAKLAPARLPANQPPQFYRGGPAIAELRGARPGDGVYPDRPEDWVGSTTTQFGQDSAGLSTLPDGTPLRAAIHSDPAGWLGERHLEAFSDSTALLVKLLDAGQRLPVHFHPTDAFARQHFSSHFGKTEAWVVVGTSGADPCVYAGFRATQRASTVRDWVHEQHGPTMVGALNSIRVAAGDTMLVPAGLPHAIGSGVFVVELQQPTDFSLTLEWRDFLADPERGHLGLGFDTALDALDLSGWDTERLSGLIRRTADAGEPIVDLLVPAAAGYFRAQRLRPAPTLALDPAFSVLIVLDGHGELRTGDGTGLALNRGETLVVPYGAGEIELAGEISLLRALPPALDKLP